MRQREIRDVSGWFVVGNTFSELSPDLNVLRSFYKS